MSWRDDLGAFTDPRGAPYGSLYGTMMPGQNPNYVPIAGPGPPHPGLVRPVHAYSTPPSMNVLPIGASFPPVNHPMGVYGIGGANPPFMNPPTLTLPEPPRSAPGGLGMMSPPVLDMYPGSPAAMMHQGPSGIHQELPPSGAKLPILLPKPPPLKQAPNTVHNDNNNSPSPTTSSAHTQRPPEKPGKSKTDAPQSGKETPNDSRGSEKAPRLQSVITSDSSSESQSGLIPNLDNIATEGLATEDTFAAFKVKNEQMEEAGYRMAGERFMCNLCNYFSTRADKMLQHITAHSQGNHVCSICNKAFVKAHDLARHKESHKKQQPPPDLGNQPSPKSSDPEVSVFRVLRHREPGSALYTNPSTSSSSCSSPQPATTQPASNDSGKISRFVNIATQLNDLLSTGTNSDVAHSMFLSGLRKTCEQNMQDKTANDKASESNASDKANPASASSDDELEITGVSKLGHGVKKKRKDAASPTSQRGPGTASDDSTQHLDQSKDSSLQIQDVRSCADDSSSQADMLASLYSSQDSQTTTPAVSPGPSDTIVPLPEYAAAPEVGIIDIANSYVSHVNPQRLDSPSPSKSKSPKGSRGPMVGEHKCHLCNYEGRTVKSLEKHLRAHKQAYKICRFCNKAFERPSDLMRHEERHELNMARCGDPCMVSKGKILGVSGPDGGLVQPPPEQIFNCKKCGFSTMSYHKLALHNRQKHSTKHTCEYCGMTFISKLPLNNHTKRCAAKQAALATPEKTNDGTGDSEQDTQDSTITKSNAQEANKTSPNKISTTESEVKPIARLDSFKKDVLHTTKLVHFTIESGNELSITLDDVDDESKDFTATQIPSCSSHIDAERIFQFGYKRMELDKMNEQRKLNTTPNVPASSSDEAEELEDMSTEPSVVNITPSSPTPDLPIPDPPTPDPPTPDPPSPDPPTLPTPIEVAPIPNDLNDKEPILISDSPEPDQPSSPPPISNNAPVPSISAPAHASSTTKQMGKEIIHVLPIQKQLLPKQPDGTILRNQLKQPIILKIDGGRSSSGSIMYAGDRPQPTGIVLNQSPIVLPSGTRILKVVKAMSPQKSMIIVPQMPKLTRAPVVYQSSPPSPKRAKLADPVTKTTKAENKMPNTDTKMTIGETMMAKTEPKMAKARKTDPPQFMRPNVFRNKRTSHYCSRCNYGTDNKFKMDEHLRAHEGRFVCKHCNKACIKASDLYRHWVTHNLRDDKGDYICDSCEYTSADKLEMENHLRVHYTIRYKALAQSHNITKCGICGKSFTRSQLFVHKRIAHGNQAQSQISAAASLRAARGWNSTPKPAPAPEVLNEPKWYCPVCEMCFGSSGEVSIHYETEHMGKETVDGTVTLPSGFLDDADLTQPEADLGNEASTSTEQPGSVSCKYCNRRFKSRRHLIGHERIHYNKRSSSNMKRSPMNKRYKIRKFKCKHCGKRFRSHHYLAQHERLHTGETPYSCSKCGQKFSLFQACKFHERRNCPARRERKHLQVEHEEEPTPDSIVATSENDDVEVLAEDSTDSRLDSNIAAAPESTLDRDSEDDEVDTLPAPFIEIVRD